MSLEVKDFLTSPEREKEVNSIGTTATLLP